MTDTTIAGRNARISSESDGAPRIASLDVMRGIAILGILFMNIPEMGASIAAAHSPLPNLIGWTRLDQVFWWARELFATGTARGLLEMLFGAGMVILTGRIADGRSGWGVALRYYWRNAVLFAFGMAHIFLVMWAGDILHIYALGALIAFPFRKLSARWLIPLGFSFAIFSAGFQGYYLHRADVDNAVVAQAQVDRAAGRKLTAEQAASIKRLDHWHQRLARARTESVKELVARRSGFAAWRQAQVDDYLSRFTDWRGPLFTMWEVVATMLLGAALFKLGVLQVARRASTYGWLTVAGYGVGVTIRAVEAWHTTLFDDVITYAWGFDDLARVMTTIGHIGVIGWLLASGVGVGLLRPFVAAGRTALSIYICQSLLCLWLLYPPFGFGLFGNQGWAALMLTAAVVDAALLLAANVWVRHFDIAPVEWAWRSIVAGKPLPWRRTAPIGRRLEPLAA